MPPVIVAYTLPVVLVFLVVELAYSWTERKELYTAKDTWNNFLIGISMFVSNLFFKYLGFWTMSALYTIRVFDAGNSWITWVLAIFFCDITFYWYHRACHEINWFWASHVVHHSSEKMNISVAFRQSLTTNISGHFLFWCWLPLVGFSPFIVIIAREMVILYQFFLHTESVKKMPRWYEAIFNTPSHHRVHHSSNPEYLDKNHGGLLIIWDKCFNTYCEEKEAPRYGLTHQPVLNGPVAIIFHTWQELFRHIRKSHGWKTALQYCFNAPGWSHDGSTLTVKQQRKLALKKEKSSRVPVKRISKGKQPYLAGAA